MLTSVIERDEQRSAIRTRGGIVAAILEHTVGLATGQKWTGEQKERIQVDRNGKRSDQRKGRIHVNGRVEAAVDRHLRTTDR